MSFELLELLTPDIASLAVNIVRPGFEKRFIRPESGHVAACIIVLDPKATRLNSSEPVILWQGSIGEQDPAKWPREYNEFALEKARLAWRTHLCGHIIRTDRPDLLEDKRAKCEGSAFYKGIIVATSGLAWEHDYAISIAIAGICDALIIGEARLLALEAYG